ncbi:MAG: hypothetical protein A2075_07580 [Geobacteraceae bacterium GWC2_58_44]|nr:MAG: hypothetical protein A2075_07580 [Geobacteraceae bacterium GWC2_58_44]HBG05566.1 hypothetical protein [Geobacter sp.]
MERIIKKRMAALVGMALISVAGLAQAQVKFAVRDTTGTTEKMVVTDKGYVGVGTNAPGVAIQTKGGSIADTQVISHYTGTDPLSSGGFLALRSSLNGTTPVLPKQGERIGYTLFGSVAEDGTPRNAAGLVGYAEADWTSTSIPAYFLFEVAATGATGRVERMRITSSGNVGIGTAAPTQKLEVNGAIRLKTTATKPTTCTSALTGVIWMTSGGTGIADSLEVCVKDATGAYAWKRVQLN